MIDDEMVKTIIGKIKPKSSSGWDGISSKLLIQMSPTIHPILRVIINQSLMTGIVPEHMKIRARIATSMILAITDLYPYSPPSVKY
jgi:hypothetical protein